MPFTIRRYLARHPEVRCEVNDSADQKVIAARERVSESKDTQFHNLIILPKYVPFFCASAVFPPPCKSSRSTLPNILQF